MGFSLGKLEHAAVAPQTRFQALVGPHVARLVRFACRRVGNPADAEDVVQEACTRAWIGFADLRDEALVLPWLYRILRSAVSDFHERHSRREQLAPTLTLESATQVAGEQGDGPLEELIASASSEQIRELLRTLPEEFALAIELHDLEGLRYCDIAEMTGVPIGTVMSRIYRGRKLLAALIVMNENVFELIALRPGPEDQLNKRRA